VVHSLFASSDDWDDQLESIESGWPAFFRILRLYLTHFRGQCCSTFQVMGFAPGPESEAWGALTGALGLGGATVGQRRNTSAGAPPLSGTVEVVREGEHPFALLLLDEPAPGAAFLNACAMGGQVCMPISFYLYGDQASAAAARGEPLWRAWIGERFPPFDAAGNGG
jgi:MYXO-CTERM domain-containing protein